MRRSILLFLGCLLIPVGGGFALASEIETGSFAPVNPEFANYVEASSDRASRPAPSESGFIPSPIDRSHLRGGQLFVGRRALEALPSSFDLRATGKLPPVKDQQRCGSCWAFAALGAVESKLLPEEAWNFSENHLKNANGFDALPCAGGNFDMAVAYLARWSGPRLETDDPYNPYDNVKGSMTERSSSAQKHIQEAIVIPGRTGPYDNENIKQALMAYGAVGTAFYWDDYLSYNNPNYSFYCGSCSGSNHAVLIVGWDDDYDKANFRTAPPGKGAFIVQNTWGPAWGEAGYFYVSYHDTTFGYPEGVAFVSPEATINYLNVYQYDPLGHITSYGYGKETAWFAAGFTATTAEQLSAVSFYTATADASYEIYVYKNTASQSGPTDGTLAANRTGSIPMPGYHTVSLASPLPLPQGQKFWIVVKLTTPGYNYPIPVEKPFAGYSSGATSFPYQSYISSNSIYWTDMNTASANTSVCLKAFTVPAPEKRLLNITKSGTGGGVVESADGGITCGSTCDASYPAGSVVTLTAAAYSNDVFAGWSGGGCSGTGACVVTLEADRNVTARFTGNLVYAVVAEFGPNGSVVCTPDVVAFGASATCSVYPAPGYRLYSFVDNGSAHTPYPIVDNVYRLPNVTANHLIRATFGPGDSLDNWRWASHPTLSGIAHGNGAFVAVGGSGPIIASRDGTSWRNGSLGGQWSLNSVACGNNGFVAVGRNGRVVTSTDGTAWQAGVSGTGQWLYAVACGSGSCVAVGHAGTIVTSKELTLWRTRASGTDQALTGVAHGNGTFVAVGASGTVLTSPDGEVWQAGSSGTDGMLYGVSYGSGTFVAVGASGTILTSADGRTWQTGNSGTPNNLWGVSYGKGAFVAVGALGTIVTSPDGSLWQTRPSGTANGLAGVACDDRTFVAVGAAGTILFSTDGVAWQTATAQTTVALHGIAYGNGRLVAMGDGGTTVTSVNANEWQRVSSGSVEALWDIVYGNGMFVAVGAAGTILTSPGGEAWQARASGTAQALYGIARCANAFVVVGASGTILTSADGAAWQAVSSGTTAALRSVACSGSTIVAVGAAGTILSSTDAAVWQSRSSGVSDDFWDVAWGKGVFVAVGDNGRVRYSADGARWLAVFAPGPTFSSLRNVAFGADTFVAAGSGGTILTSTDGSYWVARPSASTRRLWGAAFGMGNFWLVGDMGAILESSFPTGDINDDKSVDLRDAILALQSLSGMTGLGVRADYPSSTADANGDQRLGLAEALYVLQRVAGLR